MGVNTQTVEAMQGTVGGLTWTYSLWIRQWQIRARKVLMSCMVVCTHATGERGRIHVCNRQKSKEYQLFTAQRRRMTLWSLYNLYMGDLILGVIL